MAYGSNHTPSLLVCTIAFGLAVGIPARAQDRMPPIPADKMTPAQKQAVEAYTLAEQHETNPRSVWGYVQGLTRLSQRTPWQDGRFALDRAASRLLTTVH